MPFSDPEFPVINPSPDVDICLKSMRIRDYLLLAGATTTTWGYGYILGKPLRGATASTAAALGLTFAGMFVLQDTRNRLMGYSENAREVKVYGLHPDQPLGVRREDGDRRFPLAMVKASPSVRPQPRFDNYD